MQTTKRKQQLAERHDDAHVRSAPVLRLDRARSIDSPLHGPIDESIRIRDRHQFEIKLHYPISQKKKIASHDLECFIFVPRSLGLNRTNYSKARFYDDLQTHIRFKTPAVPLESIASHHDSPLRKLALSADSMTQNDTEANINAFEYRLKLFCCILQSALKKSTVLIHETEDPDKHERLLKGYLDATGAIIDDYRALRKKIAGSKKSDRAIRVYAFGDEYISLLVERHSYELLRQLDIAKNRTAPSQHRGVLELIRQEVGYRKSQGYPSIPTHRNDNEQLIFRRNVLKKYMHKVLFLNTRTKDEGTVIEHGLLGIAAGISMLFATMVLFLSQSFYGPLTMQVFLALVIGYMFKDRIKEILRVYFSRKVSSMFYDHRTRIYASPERPIGYCRESFDFVDEVKVPGRIMRIRNRDHMTEIENDWVSENILRYRKRIKLSSRAISSAYLDIDTNGIKDIMRFNVAEMTRRMGNPRKELFVLEKNGYRRVKAERVYHLNMILCCGDGEHVRYKHFRIVLNRRKIKRIETLSAEYDY
mgnify:CR=1 FL=1